MRVKAFATFVLVSVMALWSNMCYAQDFSADMVSVSSEGSFTGKIYVSGDKSRVEMLEAITISRLDQKITWILMPSDKVYMEQPINARAAASTQEKMSGEIERIAEGKETVNDSPTTKYRVIFEAAGKRETVFQWIAEGSHFPVKTAAIDNSWSSEFKNIQTGPQDQVLFEIPADYKKMAIDMPNMGN